MNFTRTLKYWYSEHKRDLPWRNTRDPYYIWLSEIIMQQTQIKQGLPYYEDFVANFPTVFHLAKAQESEVLKLWQGLGYYSRARNLLISAKSIVNELYGEFPKTYKDLLKLKGVGDYTASAIASICYNEPTAVVDGNVYRVLSRYFGIDTPINSSHGIKEFKKLAQSLLPKDKIGDYNQAVMEFGATQCKPSQPDCDVCPLNKKCIAFQTNKTKEFPIKLNKIKISKRHFNFLVFISENNKTILEQRVKKGIWRNLYQFPLIETKTTLTEEQFNKNKKVTSYINGTKYSFSLYSNTEIIHKLSHQHLYTKFWIIKAKELSCNGINISKIKSYPVPTLISNFIDGFDF